ALVACAARRSRGGGARMSVATAPSARAARAAPARGDVALCAAIAAAVLAFAAWQHLMPPGFASVLGLNRAAITATQAALGVRAPEVSLRLFTGVFRALLVVAFAGYGALLWRGYRGSAFAGRWLAPLATTTAVA